MNSNINDTFRNKIVEKFDTLIYDICKSRNVEKSIYNYIITNTCVIVNVNKIFIFINFFDFSI